MTPSLLIYCLLLGIGCPYIALGAFHCFFHCTIVLMSHNTITMMGNHFTPPSPLHSVRHCCPQIRQIHPPRSCCLTSCVYGQNSSP